VVWQYTLLIWHMCSPQVYTGSQWVRTNSGILYYYSSIPCRIFTPLILKLYNWWWKWEKYYHQHLDTLHEGLSLLPMWLFKKSICFWQILWRWDITTWIMGKINDWQNKFYNALYRSIMKHERSFHIFKIPALLWHHKSPWSGRWQLWLTVENENYIWQAQWC